MEKLKLNIQKFASGVVSLGTSGALAGQIVWSSSSNGIVANSSNVSASLQIRRTDGYTTTGTFSFGWQVGSASTDYSTWYGSISSDWVTIATHSGPVSHNIDGSGSCYISGWVTGPSGTTLAGQTVSGNQTVTLDKINRYATISSAPNFTDEANPTITYSNPAGNSVTSLQACISLTGAKADVSYRDISKTGNSYTFELTEEERNILRQATPNSNSLNVIFFVRTKISDLTFTSTLTRTMTIINANPTFSNFEFEDINPTTLALTGNSKYNINGYSTIKAIISNINKAIANKSATMSKYRFTIGNLSKDIIYSDSDEASGSIEKAPNGTYNVYAIDSRNNSTLVTKLADKIIEYTPIYIDRQNSYVSRENGGVGGDVTLTFSGTIWNNSFGAKNNSIKSAIYRFKKTTSNEWITGTTDITPTISGNEFSFSALVRSDNDDYTFDLQSSYDFEITISDELSTDTFQLTPLGSAIPNLALADNGVGIMGAYNEEIGGLLQVGGQRIDYNIETNGEAIKTGHKVDGKDEYIKRYSSTFNGTIATFNLGFSNISEITMTKLFDGYYTNGSNYFPLNIYRGGEDASSEAYILGTDFIINTSGIDRTGYTAYIDIYFTYND